MSRFKILTQDRSRPSVEFIATHSGEVLNRVQRLNCKEADVLRDGEYVFSLRLDDNGHWCVHQRDISGEGNVIPLFG